MCKISYRTNLLLFIFILSYACTLFGVDIGSDSFVERFAVQQPLNNGDRIAGFALLQAGFKLSNNSVSAIFDSFFPVMGTIELEGGTISLSKDLIFHDVSTFQTLGNITGNNNKMELSPSMGTIPQESGEVVQCGAEVCNVSYVTEASQPNFCWCCDWSYDDKFFVVGLNNSGYNNVFRVYEFNGSTLTLKDSEDLAYSTPCYDISWHPSDDFLAVGIEQHYGLWDLRIHEVNHTTGAISFVSGVDVTYDVVAVEWHPSGGWVAAGQNNSIQELAIYEVDSQGNINSIPVDSYNADAYVCARALSWNNDGSYLAVGLQSTAANELLIFSFDEGTEQITLDTSLSLGYDVYAVSWSKVSPNFLAVGLNRTSGEMLKIYEFDSSSSTLTQRAAKSDLANSVWALDWHPNSDCLALGRYGGTGYEFRVHYFDSSDYSFDQITGFEVSSLVRCASWSHGGGYIVHGCDNNKLYVYSAPGCASEAFSSFEFNNVKLFLNADVTINSALIKFTGESIINGQGNCLDLNQTGTIVIDSNASLLLKDITVKNIQDNSIYCTDSTSTLSVDNCKWELVSNYDFDAGHLEIFRDFEIIGDSYDFSYKTDQQSIIKSNARLILGENLTFKYDPSVSDRDLISLYDSTSEIILRGATLFSTIKGLRLTKGNLLVERKSYLSGDGTSGSDGISFGDGVSAENNITVQCIGAANLEILSGFVVDNTVNS